MTTKLNVAACLKAIDDSRAAEVLDDFVRDAAQRILNDGLQSAIASTDVFDNDLDMRIEARGMSDRKRGAALVRVLTEATGCHGWRISLGKWSVRVAVNRAEFIAHIESMRGKLLSPPGTENVELGGVTWVPTKCGYKALVGNFTLLLGTNCKWATFWGHKTEGEGVAETLDEAADEAIAVMRRSRGY